MKLALFDCDGTLLDSQHIIVKAMELTFAQEGLEFPGRDATLRIVGLSLPQAMAVLAPQVGEHGQLQLGEVYKSQFFQLRQDAANREPMYEGMRDIVLELAGRDDILLGIATGKSRRGVDVFLERENLTGLFQTIQTADSAPSKPHPGMVFQAAEEAGCLVVDTVVIGDTSYDMAMARSAGARAIGVTWGYHGEDELLRAGAQAMVDHHSRLLPELAAIWKGQ